MKRPSFQFYPADWRTDSSLKVCSLQARGLWVEMLCLMHELGQQDGSRYGYLELRGNPLTADQLGRLIGVSLDDLESLLKELETAGVFSLDEGGVIYSRRLARDGELKQIRSKAGSKGGSKTQAKRQAKGKAKPKQKTKQPSRARPYAGAIAEDEVEVEEEEEKERGTGGKEKTPGEVVELYHELCPSLPRCVAVGPRARSIRARAREFAKADAIEKGLTFRRLFEIAEASDFLTGREGKFRADLTWLIKAENTIKTLEGRYDNRNAAPQADRNYAQAFS